MFRFSHKAFASVAVSGYCFSGSNNFLAFNDADDLNSKVMSVAGRLKTCVHPEKSEKFSFLYEKDGVKVYSVKRGSVGKDGLPIVRIAKTVIQSPVAEITKTWFNDHGSRSEWDNICNESKVVKELSVHAKLMSIRNAGGYINRSRDFAFIICKSPGGVVDIQDYSSVCFVNVDASKEVSLYPESIRGHMNSLLVLLPKGANKTEAIYVCEVDPNVMLVPNSVVDYVMGSKIINVLGTLKKELESQSEEENNAASIEEAALIRFKRDRMKEEKLKHLLAVDDEMTSKDDQAVLVKLLEKKMDDITKQEKESGLDLSHLRQRIEKDIRAAKQGMSRKSSD